MARHNDWQEEGVRLGGILVDAAEIVQQALPRIKKAKHRKEIEDFIHGKGKFPSREALKSLEAAVIAIKMQEE